MFTFPICEFAGNIPNLPSLALWLDFSTTSNMWQDTAMTTPVTANGQTVKAVTSLVGNIAFTNNAGPLYQTAGINSKSSLLFANASSQFLESSTVFNRTQGDVFVVLQNQTIFSGFSHLSQSLNTSSSQYITFVTQNAPPAQMEVAVTTTNAPGTTTTITANTPWVLNYSSSGSTYRHFANGVQQTIGGTNNGHWFSVPTTPNVLTLGALAFSSTHINYYNGYIAEVLVYNTQLSLTDRSAVGAYLAAKWGTSGG